VAGVSAGSGDPRRTRRDPRRARLDRATTNDSTKKGYGERSLRGGRRSERTFANGGAEETRKRWGFVLETAGGCQCPFAVSMLALPPAGRRRLSPHDYAQSVPPCGWVNPGGARSMRRPGRGTRATRDLNSPSVPRYRLAVGDGEQSAKHLGVHVARQEVDRTVGEADHRPSDVPAGDAFPGLRIDG